jgi:hypothetical protein
MDFNFHVESSRERDGVTCLLFTAFRTQFVSSALPGARRLRAQRTGPLLQDYP